MTVPVASFALLLTPSLWAAELASAPQQTPLVVITLVLLTTFIAGWWILSRSSARTQRPSTSVDERTSDPARIGEELAIASIDPALNDTTSTAVDDLYDDVEENPLPRRALKPHVQKGKPRDEDDPDWHGKKRDRTQDRGDERHLKRTSRRRRNVRAFVEDVSFNPKHPLSLVGSTTDASDRALRGRGAEDA